MFFCFVCTFAAPNRQNWSVIGKFNNSEELEAFRRENSIFSIDSIKNGISYLRCSAVPKAGVQCNARQKIRHKNDDVISIVYSNNKEHNHDDILVESKKISPTTKEKILEMHSVGAKSIDIHRSLEDTGITLAQVRNFISNSNRQNGFVQEFSFADLQEYLNSKSVEPVDDMTPFIPNFQVMNEDFRYIITTKTLLRNARWARIVACDNTYKLIWQKLPVFAIGVLDRQKAFHLLAIGVSTHERESDFMFFFNAVKHAIKDYCDFEFEPEILVSDGCRPMIKAFKATFESAKHNNMCYVHMLRNVRKRLPKRIRESVLNDIRMLQVAPNETAFDAGASMFVRKYARFTKFIEYFASTYLIDPDFKHWYECSSIAPSTNNANEAFNSIIKRNYIRSELPFKKFIYQVDLLLTDYSKKYDHGEKAFGTQPNISAVDWSAGFNWNANTKAPYKVKQTIDSEKVFYVNSSKYDKKIDKELVQTIKNACNCKNLREFSNKMFCAYRLKLNFNEWRDSTCSCAFYFKHYKCKHIIGLALRYNLATIPPECNPRLIGEQPKRGRPLKRKRALER